MIFLQLNTKECNLLTRLLYQYRRELLADFTEELEKSKDEKQKKRVEKLFSSELEFVDELYKTFYKGVK